MKEIINISQSTNLRNKTMVFFGVFVLLLGCDLNIGGGADPDPNPATEILGFKFTPSNVVSVGDSLTIKIIVKDSLDSNLRYAWSVGIHGSQYSEKNNFTFKVNEGSGVVTGVIAIQKLSSNTDNVEGQFQFEIRN